MDAKLEMELDSTRPFLDDNVFLVTLDSCRYDVFEAANTPNLGEQCRFRKVSSQATFTLPSHLAMLVGNFPSTHDPLPYYNRFVKYLFFIRGGPRVVESFIEFRLGTPTIVHGFQSIGHKTIGVGAVEWFKNPCLTDPFEKFFYTGIDLNTQLEELLRELEVDSGPSFVLLNVGETHDPFSYGGRIIKERLAPKLRATSNQTFQPHLFEKQVECCEFVDSKLARLFDWAALQKRDSVFVVCADHGECMGEDGHFGHGFSHEKVLSVPMGVFIIEGTKREL